MQCRFWHAWFVVALRSAAFLSSKTADAARPTGGWFHVVESIPRGGKQWWGASLRGSSLEDSSNKGRLPPHNTNNNPLDPIYRMEQDADGISIVFGKLPQDTAVSVTVDHDRGSIHVQGSRPGFPTALDETIALPVDGLDLSRIRVHKQKDDNDNNSQRQRLTIRVDKSKTGRRTLPILEEDEDNVKHLGRHKK